MSTSVILAGTLHTFGGWICFLAIFILGMQYLIQRTSWLDYTNEAALPFYILHQTVIFAVGYFVRRWNVMRFPFGLKPCHIHPPRGRLSRK